MFSVHGTVFFHILDYIQLGLDFHIFLFRKEINTCALALTHLNNIYADMLPYNAYKMSLLKFKCITICAFKMRFRPKFGPKLKGFTCVAIKYFSASVVYFVRCTFDLDFRQATVVYTS